MAPSAARAAGGLTAAEVAEAVGGELRPGRAGGGGGTSEVGVETARLTRVATLARADAHAVSFYADRRYADDFVGTAAGAVLVSRELADTPGPLHAARVVVARPHEAMLALLPRLYAPAPREPGVHPTAVLGRGVRLGEGVTVDAYAVVGDGARLGDGSWVGAHCTLGAGVEVGEASELRPHVTLYPGTVLGRRVVLHAGARLGSDGYGYVYADGHHQKIPHVGRCVVGDDVEIGANSCVDRGSVDDTVIGSGTKIDNLVHVGHNVRIGRLCLVMAQVGISGSAVIEDGVILAGQAGVGGHLTIGAGARIAGQAGVFGDVPAGETWGGYPARPQRESMRAHAAMFRLAGMVRPLERLLARASATADGQAGG